MGALENMQEEIIPLVPVLLLLGRRLGVDAVAVVAMSAGAAMIGSAFGPTNPFQAGIAMQLAELAATFRRGRAGPLARRGLRGLGDLDDALRRASEVPSMHPATTSEDARPASRHDVAIFLLMLAPMAAYVYGAIALGWGFNELSVASSSAAIAAGLLAASVSPARCDAYLDGHAGAAAGGGDGRRGPQHLRRPGRRPRHRHDPRRPERAARPRSATTAALLMIPFHVIVHIPVLERQRPRGADDAGAGAAVRPARHLAPGHGHGVSDRRRSD